MRTPYRSFCYALVALLATISVGCSRAHESGPAARPRNIIIMIGDGMGFEHVKAGGYLAHGRAGSLVMETLPHRGEVMTHSAPREDAPPDARPVTDSAAAGTAFATGHKVYNGVLSLAIPGDQAPYQTAVQAFAAEGKMTGLVTTAYIGDATPAAFGAHAAKRGDRIAVYHGYLETVRPNLIMGGGESNIASPLTVDRVGAAGFELVTDRAGLAALQPGACLRMMGLFSFGNMPYEAQKRAGATQPALAAMLDTPSLAEMTRTAIDLLAVDPDGFFLMVEEALIDKASHKNDADLTIPQVVEFDKAVQAVMDWAADRDDTLVLVTSDHECGGLAVVSGNGPGQLPEVTWSTTGHTGANVPIYAWGVGAEKVGGVLDNTDVYRLMMGTFEAPSVEPAPVLAGQTVD